MPEDSAIWAGAVDISRSCTRTFLRGASTFLPLPKTSHGPTGSSRRQFTRCFGEWPRAARAAALCESAPNEVFRLNGVRRPIPSLHYLSVRDSARERALRLARDSFPSRNATLHRRQCSEWLGQRRRKRGARSVPRGTLTKARTPAQGPHRHRDRGRARTCVTRRG